MDQSDSVAVYFFGFLQTNNEKLEEEKKWKLQPVNLSFLSFSSFFNKLRKNLISERKKRIK
jgi:hypothetical protein